jgi:copper chaperone NosL
MFPEFVYLPYVVGFFYVAWNGRMLSAVTGKLLFAYICLTVIGGALAMYDFYQWGYDYGHNLDATRSHTGARLILSASFIWS